MRNTDKLEDPLDTRGVSFVSVTQQFNTTSSMGRLSLNVLLSFTQFERRYRRNVDKELGASKRKGMWMGGVSPLGYDLKERKLIVNLTRSPFKASVCTPAVLEFLALAERGN